MTTESTEREIDLGAVDFGALPQNPKELPAAALNAKFEHEWTVWYDDAQRRGIESEQWEEGMHNLGKISSVQDWWRYWNVLGDPSKFQDNINLRLFKSDIRPTWSDPHNENGGKWTTALSIQDLVSTWRELIFTVLTGGFKFEQDVCGIVLSVRRPAASLSVWNNTAHDPIKLTTTTAELETLFKVAPNSLKYQPHKKGVLLGAKQPKNLKGGSLAAFKRINLGAGAPPGALVRNSVDGLAALKSGNLRASMDNSRLGKNIIEKIQKKHEGEAQTEEEQQKTADIAAARRAFLGASSDKFPMALMSPIVGAAPKKKTKPLTHLATAMTAPDSPVPQEDEEWSSSDDEESEAVDSGTVGASPGGILARLPSQELKTAKENWRKTGMTIKPVRGNSLTGSMEVAPSTETEKKEEPTDPMNE